MMEVKLEAWNFAVNRKEWLYFMFEKSMDWGGHKMHWGSYVDPWHSAVGAFGGVPGNFRRNIKKR